GGVPLEPLVEAAVALHQLLVGDDAGGLVHRVQQRRGMTLGEDQVIVGRCVGRVPVVAQVARHQGGQQVRGGEAGGGVSEAGGRRAADRVDPQLGGERGDVVELESLVHGGGHHGSFRGGSCLMAPR